MTAAPMHDLAARVRQLQDDAFGLLDGCVDATLAYRAAHLGDNADQEHHGKTTSGFWDLERALWDLQDLVDRCAWGETVTSWECGTWEEGCFTPVSPGL